MKTALRMIATLVTAAAVSLPALAGSLGGDARTAIPSEVQQIIVLDYRTMQNSSAANDLKSRLMPPELKSLEDALKSSGFNENHDVDQLVFASYRTTPGSASTRTMGLAQGQFQLQDILAGFKKQKIKPTLYRTNKIYPMGSTSMVVCFLNSTTMVFGDSGAVKAGLDARDGQTQSLLSNSDMLNLMPSVENAALWSVLDQKGTQFMMRGVLGDASQLADYDTVKKRLTGSRYSLDFQNGVKFSLDVLTTDTFSGATMATMLNGALLYKKMNAVGVEKTAIDATKVDSNSGTLEVRYSADDDQFAGLLKSPLFQSVVK